jgi:MFS family permease
VVAAAIPAVFLVGMASILYSTATTAMVQIETTPDMRGRVLSLQTVLLMGTTPIGAPILGWLADATGGRTPIILGGIVCLIAATFGYYAARRYVPHTSWTDSDRRPLG